MTIYNLGKGDDIYLPRMTPKMTSFGGEVHYTKPSYDWCYSPYGFAVPLDYEGIPMRCWMDDNLPLTSYLIRRFPCSCNYLLVTHSGDLWHVSIGAHDNKKTDRLENLLSQSYIHKSDDSWWLGRVADDTSIEPAMILGFLSTNPNEEKLKEFWKKQFKAQELERLSVTAITEKLKAQYPAPDPWEEDLKSKLPHTTSAIAKILGELIA